MNLPKYLRLHIGNFFHATLFYAFNPRMLRSKRGVTSAVKSLTLDWGDQLKKIYLPLFRELAEELESEIVVVDVGARGRTLAQEWGDLADKVRFYGFELSSAEACEQMSEDDALLGVKSTYIARAVSIRSEEREFYVKKQLTGSSFYDNQNAQHIYQHWRAVRKGKILDQQDRSEILETLTVDALSLDGLMEQRAFGRVDFVKIDAEGAEFEIVQGARRVLEGALAAQLEIDFVERYNPENLFFRIDEALNSMNYSLFGFLRFLKVGRKNSSVAVCDIEHYAKNSTGQMIGADVVYLKDPFGPKLNKPENTSKETLIKTSIIAFVLGQTEYALSVAEILGERDDGVNTILRRHLSER